MSKHDKESQPVEKSSRRKSGRQLKTKKSPSLVKEEKKQQISNDSIFVADFYPEAN